MKQFVLESLTQQSKHFESEHQQQQAQIVSIVQTQLDTHKTDIEKKLEEITHKTQLENELNSKIHVSTLQNEVIPKIHMQTKLIEAQQIEIQTLNQNLTRCETEMNQIKQNKSTSQLPGTIQVICSGNDSNDRQIPKFNGRSGNPKEYLAKLKRYYNKGLERNVNHDPIEYLRDVLETSFEGPASRWLQLIRSDITNWEQFAREFENKYWSQTVQRGVKSKIEAEKYRPNGTLTRAEYLTERVLLLQSMTPALSEEEIVNLMAERFDPIVQDSVNVQNVTTIRGMERLLQKVDIKDGPKKIKNYQNEESRRPSNPTSPQPQHNYQERYANQYAYQPKMNRYNNSNQNNYNNQQGHSYNRNQPYGNRNNYSNEQPYYQRNHKEYKPYQRDPQPQRNNERSYPTKEQSQLCAIIVNPNNQNATNTPPNELNDSNYSSPHSSSSSTRQENGQAL